MSRRPIPTSLVLRHGMPSTYSNYGCRCRSCKAAHAAAVKDARARRAAWLKADPTLAPHGRASTYTNWGCRCRACTTAHSTYRWEASQ